MRWLHHYARHLVDRNTSSCVLTRPRPRADSHVGKRTRLKGEHSLPGSVPGAIRPAFGRRSCGDTRLTWRPTPRRRRVRRRLELGMPTSAVAVSVDCPQSSARISVCSYRLSKRCVSASRIWRANFAASAIARIGDGIEQRRQIYSAWPRHPRCDEVLNEDHCL